jgi:hypothetical protein
LNDANTPAGTTILGTMLSAAAVSNMTGYGTFASMPTTGVGTYYCSDVPYTFLGTGSSGKIFWRGIPAVIPSTTGWTWDNQGTSTLNTMYGCHTLVTGGGAGSTYNVYAREISAPPTPYHITAMFEFDQSGLTSTSNPLNYECAIAFGFRDSGTKLLTMQNVYNLSNTAGNTGVYVNEWPSSSTTPYGISLGTRGSVWFQSPIRWRIEDDGINLNFYNNFPIGSTNWIEVYTQARGSFLSTGPIAAMWGSYTYGGQSMLVSLVSWAVND